MDKGSILSNSRSHLKYSASGPHSFNFRNAVFPCFVPIVISLQHGSQSFRLPASFIPSLKSSVVTTFSFLHSLMAQAPHFRHISKLNPPFLWLDGKNHLCISSCCEIPTITQPFQSPSRRSWECDCCDRFRSDSFLLSISAFQSFRRLATSLERWADRALKPKHHSEGRVLSFRWTETHTDLVSFAVPQPFWCFWIVAKTPYNVQWFVFRVLFTFLMASKIIWQTPLTF